MPTMRCGVAVVEALRAVGVSTIFGLMGSSTLEIYDALYDATDLTYIGVRHENCGMHMADAYGRVTQTPGVFLCGQAGPGAANMVLGLAQAKLAYAPAVIITGLPGTEHLGRDTFQEIDQHVLFQPVTKRTFTVPRPERLPEFIFEAFRVANSGRRGPVVVNIPRDLLNHEIDVTLPTAGLQSVVASGAVDHATVEQIKAYLLAARAPVIHAGAGIKWGRGTANLLRLAEALQVPITTSAGHGDVAPVDHPLYAGGVGPRGNPVASRLTREADCLLALGTRLGFNTTFYRYTDLNPAARIIQVDIDPLAIGRYFPVTLGVVADAGTVAGALADCLPPLAAAEVPWQARNAQFRQERDALLQQRAQAGASTRTPLHPDRVYAELRQVAPRDAIFTLDAGTTGLQATDQLPYRTVPALLTPLDCGMIGFSYAAGLGAKVAAPQRTVLSLMGDGGFGMTMGEMATAVQHNIATIAIVMDNGAWGSEIAYQRDFYQQRYIGAKVCSPRFDEVMRLCGGRGYLATAPGDTAEAVHQAMQAGLPAVVHVMVDPEAVLSFRRDALQQRT
ncbi:MAG: thiamine pyrophosphate-binding protein [Candidatus Tectimicrobiota bacterium]